MQKPKIRLFAGMDYLTCIRIARIENPVVKIEGPDAQKKFSGKILSGEGKRSYSLVWASPAIFTNADKAEKRMWKIIRAAKKFDRQELDLAEVPEKSEKKSRRRSQESDRP